MMKVGILGCGKIAERHIAAYRQLPVEPVVADVAERVARSVADRYGISSRDHPEEILSDPTVAAVDVCVPTIHHRDVILQALSYGKHVFCEKPLCRTVAEAHEIKNAVGQTNRVLMVGYLQRFHPAFQLVKQALDDSIIGRPHLATFRVGGRGDHAPWKHRNETGGGVVFEMLVHKLDQILWFFGPVDQLEVLVYDTLRPLRSIGGKEVRADAEDLVLLQLEAGGVRAVCQGDFLTPSYMDHLEIQGDNGSIFASLLHFLPTIIHCKEPRGIYNVGSNFYTFPMVNLFEHELAHFIDVIENGRAKSMNGLADSIRLLELVEMIRKHPQVQKLSLE